MKKIKWENPNKMVMESGHKTFDQQTNYIGTGNVFANTQTSLYIRGYNETECNGFTFPKGELQKTDLKGWYELPQRVHRAIREYAVDESVILYKFFHKNSKGELVVHGYVLTSKKHELIDYIVVGPTYKSWDVINECLKYITVQEQAA